MKSLIIAAILLSLSGVSAKWQIRLEKPRHVDIHSPGGYVHVGRVEVKHENDTEWGTVCGPIDRHTAQLMCAALGDVSGGWTFVPSFPDGQGLIRMSNVACNGTWEFDKCTYTESTSTEKLNQCSHLDDVGLGCFNNQDWTPQLQGAVFDLTHKTENIGRPYSSNLATDIREMLSLPAEVDIVTLSDDEETNNPDWRHFIFKFSNASHMLGNYLDWHAAATFHQISDSYLYTKYDVYNAMSNIEQPIVTSPEKVLDNPSYWEWRLVEKDPFQKGSFTGVYSDSVRMGRVEMRPGPTAQWGSVCGSGLGLEAVASICNTIASAGGGLSTLRTPWTVLPIYYYGAGDGPIWLNKVQCEDKPPLTFHNNCPDYIMSLPTDRGNNYCDHTLDVGINCQADITTSVYWHTFTAFVPVQPKYSFKRSSAPDTTFTDVKTMLKHQICDYFGVPRYRWRTADSNKMNADASVTEANGYYMVEFTFTEPEKNDLHIATQAALDQAIQLIRPEGLKEIFAIDEMLVNRSLKPTAAPDAPATVTPVPNYEPNVHDAKYVFAVEVSGATTQTQLFTAIAAWANSKAFMFISTIEYPIVIMSAEGKNLNLKRVEFFIRGQPVSAAVTDALNEKLHQGLIGNVTAYGEIGIHGFLLSTDSSVPEPIAPHPTSHSARTAFVVICIFLILMAVAAFIYNRQRNLARDARLYEQIGHRSLDDGTSAGAADHSASSNGQHQQPTGPKGVQANAVDIDEDGPTTAEHSA